MEITLRQLACLVAVADHGSISAAAVALDVTQPTVTHQLKLLEDLLGYRLVDRSARGITVRPEGQIVVDRARVILQQTASLADDLVDIRTVHGEVRLGIIQTASAAHFPFVYRSLMTRYPDVHLMVTEGRSMDLVEKVRHGDLDLAVVTLPLMYTDLQVAPLWREELVLIDNPSSSVQEEAITIKQLDGLPFIGLDVGTGLQRHVLALFHENGIQPRLIFQATSIATVIGFVAAGLGISIVPNQAARVYADVGQIVVRHLNPAAFRQLVLIYRPLETMPSAVRVIAQTFITQARRFPRG
ncbi:MAG: LysR family transcriptional regulator [Sulfobacillus thermosulfidooxidans]|uniref:LysR family transcriptional regulator n=1 Tax=Sulfobacillus thermosulfidooxidans TaxID=28034 RepID=A0A2T2X040_SULTH|nr:MAG: LysR family transcriptional regulator [Sulfobacillus thermosulfidooxidans]